MLSFSNVKIYVGNKPIEVVSSTELMADEVTRSDSFESNKNWKGNGLEFVSCTIDEFSRGAMDLLLGRKYGKRRMYEKKKFDRLIHSDKARYKKWCNRYLNRKRYIIRCNNEAE